MPPAELTAAEQRLIDGPVAQLCAMLDEWDITWLRRDLPEPVLAVLKSPALFRHDHSEQYGGPGLFSVCAFGEVVTAHFRLIRSRRGDVMVPNSLRTGRGFCYGSAHGETAQILTYRAWPTAPRVPMLRP